MRRVGGTATQEQEQALPAHRVLRTPAERLSLRVEPRAVTVGAILATTALVLGVASIAIGDSDLGMLDVVRALTGASDRATEFIVMTLRLPRVITALLVGAALGMSGAVFQTLARNPLGSPDIVGFTRGAATGAVLQITVFGGSMLAIAGSAVIGGVVTSLAVYLLAFKRGAHGYRLVLVGVGVSAMLQSINAYLLTRANLSEAQGATVWLLGSLNGRGWEHAVPVALSLGLLLPAAIALSRQLAMLGMGDEVAQAVGMVVERSRLTLVLIAAALCAVATAAAGPIAFVALAAPQLARRLTHTSGAGLVNAGLMGSFLLVASDLAARRLLAPTQLPVGIMTGAVGGLYLAWLLSRELRSGRG